MAEEKGFSFGDASFTAQSRKGWYGMSKEAKGLPAPSLRHNQEDIAIIQYHHVETWERVTLVGFLPSPQAMDIVSAKNGDTFWSVVMIVPSLDTSKDLELLCAHMGDCYKDLRRVYLLGTINFTFLMNWAYMAYGTIGINGLTAQVANLTNERDMFRIRSNQAELARTQLVKSHAALEESNRLAQIQIDEYRAEIDALKRKLSPKDISGYVYLLKMVNGDYFKIGRTKDPKDRLKTFNVKLPFEVEYEHLIQTEDMYKLEAELHTRYAAQRVNGEWFALSQPDIDYIKGL